MCKLTVWPSKILFMKCAHWLYSYFSRSVSNASIILCMVCMTLSQIQCRKLNSHVTEDKKCVLFLTIIRHNLWNGRLYSVFNKDISVAWMQSVVMCSTVLWFWNHLHQSHPGCLCKVQLSQFFYNIWGCGLKNLHFKPWLVWLSWMECSPINQKVVSSIPTQGTSLGCGFCPWLRHTRETSDGSFSLTSM